MRHRRRMRSCRDRCDRLDVAGFALLTNVAGIYLADESYLPICEWCRTLRGSSQSSPASVRGLEAETSCLRSFSIKLVEDVVNLLGVAPECHPVRCGPFDPRSVARMAQLDGRRIVVTGSTRGLGRAFAEALTTGGAHVALIAHPNTPATMSQVSLSGRFAHRTPNTPPTMSQTPLSGRFTHRKPGHNPTRSDRHTSVQRTVHVQPLHARALAAAMRIRTSLGPGSPRSMSSISSCPGIELRAVASMTAPPRRGVEDRERRESPDTQK